MTQQGMHTVKYDSAVGCTPWSMTQQCDAHHEVWLSSGMHSVKYDSAVGCTP